MKHFFSLAHFHVLSFFLTQTIVQNILSAHAVHDSLNFVLMPKKRECFFEDFEEGSLSKTVEVFVEAGGNSVVYFKVNFNDY